MASFVLVAKSLHMKGQVVAAVSTGSENVAAPVVDFKKLQNGRYVSLLFRSLNVTLNLPRES
jgi:hypothetical protein